jgi:SAM-dependent methyltransferase
MAKKKEIYNKTQLTPQQEFERHIYHRDQFAHYLRWTHILKVAKIGMKILDFGCGSGEMLEVFYRNKYRPKQYLGLDIRQRTIEENSEKFSKLDFAEFRQCDLCQDELDLGQTFDIITCFEVIEHIGHENADAFLDNIAFHCGPETRVYLSTPNYDPQVGAANNHLLGPDKEVGEWDHFELQKKLEEFFIIENKFGTFASMRDYKKDLVGWRKDMFDALHEYYDSNLIANIMAPLVPAEHARNCLWVLRVREDD